MEVWSELERALNEAPTTEREALLSVWAGAWMRIHGRPDPLPALVPAAREAALVYVAERGGPARAALADAVRALPESSSVASKALRLWAGIWPDTLPGALVPILTKSLELGTDPVRVVAFAERALGASDIGTDTLRVDAVTRIAASGQKDAHEHARRVAHAIAFPPLRLHGLFVAAFAPGAYGDSPLVARETFVAIRDDELAPGLALAQLAALTADEELLERAIMVLDRPSANDTRARLWSLLFAAAIPFGVHRWRPLVERLREDKVIMRDGRLRGRLLWDAVKSAFRIPSDEARADGLGALAENARRLPHPGQRARVYAEMAKLVATIPNQSSAIWLDEAKKALALGDDDRHLASTLRTLASIDVELVARLVAARASPAERVVGWAIVAEAIALTL